MIKASLPSLTRSHLVLDSREAILDLAPLLENLAERCGQPGAMHWLPYFLDPSVTGRRVPYLVLLLRPEESQGRSLSADDIEAAALFFEYRLFGIRTGAVTTGDAVGFSSVIAPQGQRASVATIAARALVGRGATIVLATYQSAGEPEAKPMLAGWPGVLWAWKQRQVGRTLQLCASFDETLARMGKSTRFNLRYYRRRFEKQHACEYVPAAAAQLRGVNLQEINAASLHPVHAAEFERRVHSATHLAGSFLVGLRGEDGRWLSLIGGWRQGATTVLHWQTNAAGFEKHSIGTIMRSFFLEHEIANGARSLLIYGGTPHTMRHSFEQESVADLVVRRKTLRGRALQWASRFIASPGGLTGRPNFLADTLCSPDLQWAHSPAVGLTHEAGAAKPSHSHKTA